MNDYELELLEEKVNWSGFDRDKSRLIILQLIKIVKDQRIKRQTSLEQINPAKQVLYNCTACAASIYSSHFAQNLECYNCNKKMEQVG